MKYITIVTDGYILYIVFTRRINFAYEIYNHCNAWLYIIYRFAKSINFAYEI